MFWLFFQERRIEFFKWVAQVVDNMRGTNKIIEDQLDEIFQRNIKQK